MSEAFEQFWKAYPKRPGNPKAPALKEWQKLERLGLLPPIEEMLLAVNAYYKHCVKVGSLGSEYIAHARTWLYQHRWEAWMPDRTEVLPLLPQTNIALPIGYEDAVRKLIGRIGAARYQAFFGKAQWSNGGDVIKIKCASPFDRQTILINYVDDLEALTGKTIEVTAHGQTEN